MNIIIILASLLLSYLASDLLLRASISGLRKNLLSHPTTRSSHQEPTPSGGGFSFVAVATISALMSLVLQPDSGEFGLSTTLSGLGAIPLLVLPLAILGFLDDQFNLRASLRLFLQVIFTLFILSQQSDNGPILDNIWLAPVFIVFMCTLINFANFVDGLDGLLGGCGAIILVVAAIKLSAPFPIWSLVGALLAFLNWNWNPAKVFMGDVGSTFIGGVFALLILRTSSWEEAISILLVATPLLADALVCILQRFFAGHNLFEAHRLHLYQRLQKAGWSHSKVSILYIGATSFMALGLFAGGLLCVSIFAIFIIAIGFWLDSRFAEPF